MLTFAVVTSMGTGPLSADRQRQLEHVVDQGTLDGQLVFPVADRSVWFNHDRSIAVVVWSSGFDPFAAGDAWEATDDSFTAFSGHVWPRGRGWDWKQAWAPQLGRFCERSQFPGDVDQLSGTFTAVHVRSRGAGHVFADPFSIGNVYLAERADCAVFSSRAAIAAWLAAPKGHAPRRDPVGIGWLGFAGVILDDVTGFEGVRLLRQCARIELGESGDHVIRSAVHPAHWYTELLPPHEAAELARQDLEAELAAVSGMTVAPVLADLTGGKDSRMILSAILSAGVADRYRFSTAGPPDLPDVRLADRLVEMFGLTRGRPFPLPPAEAERWQVRERQDDLSVDRRFVFGTSGMCTLWSAEPMTVPSLEVKLNGVGGEPWYTNYPASGNMTGLGQFHGWLYAGQKIGDAGLVAADARRHYESVIADMAEQLCEGSRTPQDAVDKYYLRVRMRRWFGTLLEVDRRNRVLPLFSAPSIAAAFALGSRWRHAQFLPYSIMAAVDTRLVTTPFAGDVWPKALGELVESPLLTPDVLSSPERPVSGVGGEPSTVDGRPSSPKRNVSTDTRTATAVARLEKFRALVVDDPSHPLFDVLDREAVRHAVDSYVDLPHPQKQQVFGAFTAGLWLGGHEEPLYGASTSVPGHGAHGGR
ncbi:MAG: hypothetical protein ABWZ52_08180 [Acidimicrobiales bacterium]